MEVLRLPSFTARPRLRSHISLVNRSKDFISGRDVNKKKSQ